MKHWLHAILVAGLTACAPRPEAAVAPVTPPAASAAASAPPAPAAGQLAGAGAYPALDLPTFAGGRISLVRLRGKWVLVNTWASWCGPCLEELPKLAALDGGEVSVIGLAMDDAPEGELTALLKKHGVRYPNARVEGAKPLPGLGAPRTLPVSWLIAPDGRVARRFDRPVTAADVRAAIAAAGQ